MTGDPVPDHVAAYQALGLRCYPLPWGAKNPTLKSWQLRSTAHPDPYLRLHADAGTNPIQHNIGITPDVLPDGRWLWVIDVDGASHGVDGETWWRALQLEHGEVPPTWTAVTGGGGTHVFLGSPIRQRNGYLLGVPHEDIQTRGHGGFVIAPPSAPDVSHSGFQPYHWAEGSAPWQRPLADAPAWLLELAATGARTRTEPPSGPKASGGSDAPMAGTASLDRPGDAWAAMTTWAALLEADGWQHHHDEGDETYWTRPGKDLREGVSATTNYQGSDTLKVFTSSVPTLTPEATYTKLGYYAATRHGGDHASAARELRRQGFHATPPPTMADLTLSAPQAAPAGRDGQPQTIEGILAAPEPIPPPPAPPAWPDDVLPDWAQAMVELVADQVYCPRDLPGMFVLGALSAAAIGHVEVLKQPGHVEPVTMYLLVAAGSSEGKSPALGYAWKPLIDLEEQWIEWARGDVAEAQQRKAIAEKRAKTAAEAAALHDEQSYTDKAIEARRAVEAIEVPPEGRLRVSDVTPEKLGPIMAANAERAALVSDEAGVLDFNRYKKAGGTDNIDLYLQAWRGEPVMVDRVSAPPVRLRKPLLTVCVGAQPSAWLKALSNPEYRDRGLGARFMAVSPAPIGHLRPQDLDRDVWVEETAVTYRAAFQALAARWHATGEPVCVTLSPDARDIYKMWATGTQQLMQPGGVLAEEASWVNKMRDTVIRAAALLWLADGHASSEPVDGAVMARACTLGDYWIGHRLQPFDVDPHGPARDLLAGLRRLADDTPDGLVTARMIARNGPYMLRAPDVHAPLIVELAVRGLVVVETALPDAIQADPVSYWRAARGLRVVAEAAVPKPTRPATTRDTRDLHHKTPKTDHGESEEVAMSRCRGYTTFLDQLSTETDELSTGASDSSRFDPPPVSFPGNARDTATPDDAEWSNLDGSLDVEPWSLLGP